MYLQEYQYAGNGWERLSKQAETLADNVASFFSILFPKVCLEKDK